MKNVQDLFTIAGGSVQIAALLKLNQYTVDRWHKTGVPQKYWEFLIKEFNVTPAELYVASKKARGGK